MKKIYLAILLSFSCYSMAHAQLIFINYGRLEAEVSRRMVGTSMLFVDSANYTFNTGNTNNYYDTVLGHCGYNTARYYDQLKDVEAVDTQSFHTNKRIASLHYWQNFGSGLVPSYFSRHEYTAGSNPRLTANISVQLVAPNDSMRELYVYNSNGLQTEYREESWDNTNSVWVPAQRDTLIYNTNNELEVSLRQKWYTPTSSWADQFRRTNTWTAGNKTQEVLEQYFMGNWVNMVKSAYAYSGTQLGISETWLWDVSAWIPDNRQTYTYGSMGVTKIEYQSYNGLAYENMSQITYEYKPGLEIETQMTWNATTSQYEMQNGDQELRRYYQKSSSVEDKPNTAMPALRVHPVPARDVLHVQASIDSKLPAILYLTDMQGRTLQQTKLNLHSGKADELVDVSNVPAGNYLLRISSGAQHSFQKITIAK
jgi:hypothetical protein